MARGGSFSLFQVVPCCTSHIDPIKQLVAVFRNYGRVYVAHDGVGDTAEEILWCEQISRENECACHEANPREFFFGGKADKLSLIIIEGSPHK